MDLQPERLNVRPLAASAAGVDRIRLRQAAQGLRLVASSTLAPAGKAPTTRLAALPLTPSEGPWTAVASIEQLLPPPPAWDLAHDAAGHKAGWVMERAMGATYSVRLTDFDRQDLTVPAQAGLVSHSRPSFVQQRGDDATQRVLAIADDSQALLFERDAGGRFQRRAVLCDCIDAQLLPKGAGYLLVFKRRTPGPVRGTAIAPGSLHLQELTAAFEPTAAAREPFPGLKVYEFAADSTGGRIALLATTSDGTRLFQSRSADGPWLALGLAEDALGAALRSPTVSLAADATAIALLDSTAGKPLILFGGTRRVPPP